MVIARCEAFSSSFKNHRNLSYAMSVASTDRLSDLGQSTLEAGGRRQNQHPDYRLPLHTRWVHNNSTCHMPHATWIRMVTVGGFLQALIQNTG